MKPSDSTVANLLERVAAGTATREVADRLYEEIYAELKRIAGVLMRGQRREHTLRPSDVVHEAYLRMIGSAEVVWTNRAHFLRSAAQSMRHILVDYARRRATEKRGGGWRRITLSTAARIGAAPEIEILDLHRALEALGKRDARMASVVELRVFAGMTSEETAHVLGVSKRTADSDWKVARVWLADRMSNG
jgi:RNA polymerase sigma factor (TIGR02999 family)